jgi:hypothetical protein
LSENNKPHDVIGPDPKWRFFWKSGTLPPTTRFPDLNLPAVIPKSFPQWESVMNRWGTLMMDVCATVAEMTSIGLGLEPTSFTSMAKYGPHLLAPTGSDLNKYGALDTIFAGNTFSLSLSLSIYLSLSLFLWFVYS